MKTKRCPKCKRTLPVSMFYKDKVRYDGCQVYCKECAKIKSKKYWRENKDILKDGKRKEYRQEKYKKLTSIMNELKINGCAICGYNECTAALDFHHVNPEDKKFQLSMQGLNRTNEKIVEELSKCILLCKNCHTKVHYTKRGRKI